MIGSIGTFYSAQNHTVSDPLKNNKVADQTMPHDDSNAKKASAKSFSELVTSDLPAPADNNIRSIIHGSINLQQPRSSSSVPLQTTTEVEVDKNRHTNGMVQCWTDRYGGSFEGYTICAGVSETSTPENPIVYVETWENGVNKAYEVEVDKVDLTHATRVEVAAVLEYNKHSVPETVYWDFISQTVAPSMSTNPSFSDTINFFDECRKYIDFVNFNYDSSSPIRLSPSPDKTSQEQFLETAEAMTSASERMDIIGALQDERIAMGLPLIDPTKDAGITVNVGEVFKSTARPFDETKNQQIEMWDDFFAEREKKATEGQLER